ncbi:OsmC family protein [Fodinicola feengrottensis]|uniref:OsmC family protein n=1 Tax=Fodinicola feengrottensis TaxID=435914 RepID=A0ABP4SWV8_9ACTN|nr:OsmC family protein [Fodinicola feengrottensis]
MAREHGYAIELIWTGNRGEGTTGYRRYGRENEVWASAPLPIEGSADPVFRGDRDRWNPEQLLVAALSECHMLSYLAECSRAAVVVSSYEDSASGIMRMDGKGSAAFTEVLLRPRVMVTQESMLGKATELHDAAHRLCFIANSVNFPVRHQATVTLECR